MLQAITAEHNVSIKFPEREPQLKTQVSDGGEGLPNQTPPTDTGASAASRNIIIITGRKENCDAAKQALMVCVCE